MTDTTALTIHEQAIIAGWKRANHLPPLGYICRDRTVGFEPDPTVFPIVRKIWALALAGSTTSMIAKHLDERLGFRTPHRGRTGGRPLSRRGVWLILRDPTYTGRVRWRGGLHRATHPTIVNDEEFTKVQRLLAERRPR